MEKLFCCIDCGFKFATPNWDGSNAVCPNCKSIRWQDISDIKQKTVRPTLPSDESPYP